MTLGPGSADPTSFSTVINEVLNIFCWTQKDLSLICPGAPTTLNHCSVDLIKGYTKASVVAFILMVAAENDVEADWEKLVPLMEILDKAWLLPCHAPGFKP